MQIVKRKPITLSSDIIFGQTDCAEHMSSPQSEQFYIKAYTGAIVDTFFGKLVFDITGMSAKPTIPILREHERDRVVGYGSGNANDGSFDVVGKFSKHTKDAIECAKLADEGYPWQASVGVRPTKVRILSAKETAMVNGSPVSGPAEIWTASEVGEVSFVSLGADSNTSISTFSDSAGDVEAELEISDEAQPQETIKEELPMTKEELLAAHPEIAAELKDEGIKEERTRVMAILSESTDHMPVLKQAIELGTPADAIFKALYEAEKNFRASGLQKLADQAPQSVGQTRDETIDTPTVSFSGKVAELMATGITRASAIKQTAGVHPELHKQYIAKINEGR